MYHLPVVGLIVERLCGAGDKKNAEKFYEGDDSPSG